MKKKRAWLAVLLCLALAGCSSQEPPVDPEPSPSVEASPSPTPGQSFVPSIDPQEDPKGYLMTCLNQAMAGEKTFIRFWLHPGSGPTPEWLPTEEYGESIRAIFEELDWEKVEEPSYESEEEIADAPFNQPGAYSVSIYLDIDTGDWIGLGKGDPVVMLGNNGQESVYLRADGADKLCDALTDLMPDPYYNLGRTRVPKQESEKATLKLYLETALKRTKELGHITDYELRAYAVTSPAWEGEGVSPGFQYTATYAYKPAHPESAYWKDYAFDADGWAVATIEEQTETLLYDERDGRYGMY